MKQGQAWLGNLLTGLLALVVLSIFLPVITNLSCQQEKGTIGDLQGQLTTCQNQIGAERQKTQDALSGLGNCQDALASCNRELSNCTDSYSQLQKQCEELKKPVIQYHIIKIFSDRMTFFNTIIVYHVQSFFFFLSFGITFTVKLFEIDVEIKVLNKRNQRRVVKAIREYLIKHPWSPILWMLLIILITNLLQLLLLL